VNFHDGQAVRKGDVLFEIDPRPYEATLERAVGDLKRLEALKSKSQADLARAERLRPSGAISIDEYEQQVSMVAVHSASIESARAAVRDATLNLEFTKIVAPIDGRVSRARITEGNLVQPGGGDGAVLTTVVTVDPIYVYFNIDEPALLKYLELGKKAGGPLRPDRIQERKIPVQVGLASEDGFPHTGILDFMDNKVDATTGTLRARGLFVNANQYFTPGLFVRVRIPYGQPHEALLVSEKALRRDQREKFLLTVNKDNVVEHRLVKVGALHGGFREVTAGLQAKEWVVVKGLLRARPGVTVAPEKVSAVLSEAAGSSPELVQGPTPPAAKARN
jgi:RND family efflux transporter MFP subunit